LPRGVNRRVAIDNNYDLGVNQGGATLVP
jgi:hypothetical protein